MDDSRRCTAHSKQSGQRCKRAAIPGGTICSTHGGKAPQVQRAARERMADLVDPSIKVLREALNLKNADIPWASRVAAAKDALDRAGLKNTENVNLTMLGPVTALDPERLAAMSNEEIDTGMRIIRKMLGRGEGDG